uniref:Uncharacterized protein n=1 Tax=Cucumis melo TaxID=3656 RepID=A0A9I9CKD9_CUCME
MLDGLIVGAGCRIRDKVRPFEQEQNAGLRSVRFRGGGGGNFWPTGGGGRFWGRISTSIEREVEVDVFDRPVRSSPPIATFMAVDGKGGGFWE